MSTERPNALNERAEAEAIVLRALAESERSGSRFLLSAIGAVLSKRFNAPRIYQRFGFARLRDFIDAMDTVGADSAGLVVVRKESGK